MTRLTLFILLTVSAFAQPATPTISWPNPAGIRYPAPLTATQLTATANVAAPTGDGQTSSTVPVPGTFVYTPPLGTVLSPGSDQTLTAVFTPADSVNFTTATATVKINVLGEWEPYFTPVSTTVCQMETPTAPAVDPDTGLPRCFVVPHQVSYAMTKFLLTQTAGLTADGKTAYKYASWWDYVVKFFINQMVMPSLDAYPPPDLATAKATAASAAAAVDAAKAAILQGSHQ